MLVRIPSVKISAVLVAVICCLVQPAWCITWKECGRQDAAWYKSPEAVRIAENVLLYQADNGGWDKNDNVMTKELGDDEKKELLKQKDHRCSLDNGATHSQMRYLAMVYAATGRQEYKDGFLKGIIDYLLKAQYSNGGWPQFFPLRQGYYTHITFNDGAMIGAISMLDDVVNRRTPYDLADESLRAKCRSAVEKGIDCILKCQVVVDGRKTAWTQQYDEVTLKPAKARAYELPAISGAESVGIVSYLMNLDKPSPQVMDAVDSAVKWFEHVKITGCRVILVPDVNAPRGMDRRVVADPNGEPFWARYYEIGTNKPLFVGRDSLPKYSISELDYAMRNSYAWFGRWPAKLLEVDYPAWRRKCMAVTPLPKK